MKNDELEKIKELVVGAGHFEEKVFNRNSLKLKYNIYIVISGNKYI